jgi:putative hydrolase of the HAD superfamily
VNVSAVFFDVDFTLIYPGPTFRGEGYRSFCERHGMQVDESLFAQGVASAACLLEAPDDVYDAEVFVAYTRHIIEHMGGRGDRVDACAREIYDEWAACHHFHQYDEVPAMLRELSASGLRIGLISNSHRCLTAFQSHFDLRHVVTAAISGPEHGLMKPNPTIFRAALKRANVDPHEAVMVGDSLSQDVEGALGAGMRGVLLHRSDEPHARATELASAGVPIINSLTDLRSLLVGC